MADTFFGATLTLATSATSFEIMEGSKDASSVEVIDTSYIGTTGGYRTKIPGDLIDGGAYTFTVLYDPNDGETDFVGVSQTCTVTYPIPTGGSTGATWAFTGFVSEYSQELPLDDKMTAEVTLTVGGQITQNDST